jgi:hypothetical protein
MNSLGQDYEFKAKETTSIIQPNTVTTPKGMKKELEMNTRVKQN